MKPAAPAAPVLMATLTLSLQQESAPASTKAKTRATSDRRQRNLLPPVTGGGSRSAKTVSMRARARAKKPDMLVTGTWPYRDRAMPLAKIECLRGLAPADRRHRLGAQVPGTRFGINSAIGLAPGVGDVILALISLYFVYEATGLGLPRRRHARMLRNVAFEAVLGAVPVLGDLFDVVWKADLRNVDIIDRHFDSLAR